MTQISRTEHSDIGNCELEPIRVPGSIQPHGILLVVNESDYRVEQASANSAEYFGLESVYEVIGKSLNELLKPRELEPLLEGLRNPSLSDSPLHLGKVSSTSAEPRVWHDVLAHQRLDRLILEFEGVATEKPVSYENLYPLVRTFLSRLQEVSSIEDICELAASEVRRITGYDRALIYQFDADWNGSVIAEARNEALPSYMGLRFPASDIPAQARELYRVNRIRVIPNAYYEAVAIEPSCGPDSEGALDLTCSILRSVSPVHLEYMRNMGTGASMSMSIMREDRLWGLISCHSKEPRHVAFEARIACELLAQSLSMQLAAKVDFAASQHRVRLKAVQAQLMQFMAEEEAFIDGLARHPEELLSFAEASAAAIVFEGHCTLVGDAPNEEQVRSLVEWLSGTDRAVFATDHLAASFAAAANFAAKASGVLAISISEFNEAYILWFRPEVERTVNWGGDPAKAVTTNGDVIRLHPRKSFALWRETVRGRSKAWHETEIEEAGAFRSGIVGIVLKKAEELASLSMELQRSNKELEAFSYSVSHDLRAPFRHIVGYAELIRDGGRAKLDADSDRYLATIINSAEYAGTLVDNLLSFSQVGRRALTLSRIDMNALVAEIVNEAQRTSGGRKIDWKIGDLPEVRGDVMMIRQAVTNLVSNAVKYTSKRDQATIEINVREEPREHVFVVRDDGVGFDMKYVDKLFGVFQRLHRMEDFEGTGIGLANVRRIAERHSGRAWAEGEVDQGATLYFALPKTG